MFRTVGEGGHRGILDTLATRFHIARRCLVSTLVAASLPSFSSRRSGHHLMPSLPRFPPQASSHLVVCHIGSRHFFTGEHCIMMHLLASCNEFSSSVSTSKSSNVTCAPLWSRRRPPVTVHSPQTVQWGSSMPQQLAQPRIFFF